MKSREMKSFGFKAYIDADGEAVFVLPIMIVKQEMSQELTAPQIAKAMDTAAARARDAADKIRGIATEKQAVPA